MIQWINKLFQDLLLLIMKLLDGVQQMFNILLGLEPVYYDINGVSTPVNLVDFFLHQEIVVQIFLMLFVISIVVIAVSCIYAIFRSMFFHGNGERKTSTRVLGQGASAIITTLLCAVITIIAITTCNAFIGVVNKVITGNEPMSMSRVVLELGLSDGEITDYTTMNALKEYQLSNGATVNPPSENSEYMQGSGDNSFLAQAEIYQDLLSEKGDIWDEENKSWKWIVKLRVGNGGITTDRKFNELFDENGYLRSDVTSDEIWGTYTTNWVGLPDGGWTADGAIHGETYNALLPYISVFILLYVIVGTCFSLVKRLFDIISLFFVLPFCNATAPMDDGAHMKLWRETMISKVLMAYGAVFALGVFTIVAPLISNITIENTTLNQVLKLVLVVGAGLSIHGGMTLFARLVGTGVAESNDMAQTARALLGGGLGAVMLGGQAIKLAKGGSEAVRSTVTGMFSKGNLNPAKTDLKQAYTKATGAVGNGTKTALLGAQTSPNGSGIGGKILDGLDSVLSGAGQGAKQILSGNPTPQQSLANTLRKNNKKGGFV